MTSKHEVGPGARTSDFPSSPLALGLIAHELQGDVARIAQKFDLRLSMYEDRKAFQVSVGRLLPDLVLIDSDIMGHPCEVCYLIHSLSPAPKLVIVACFWSEHEETLRDCADVLVHRPVRRTEWTRALADCGVPERRTAVQIEKN